MPQQQGSSRRTVLLILELITIISNVSSFPDGAPGSACVRHKPNHGGKAQPLSQMPFSVTASSSTYRPGETVAVKIAGKWGKYFKGFFVQASDERGRWIGHFEPTDFSVSHPECAATTHHDKEDKEEVTLVWHPPSGNGTEEEGGGTVRFLASVLKSYKLYWVDAPAISPEKSKATLLDGKPQQEEKAEKDE